jgi:para-aminobenzoate synthetase/4-amino-4-deoxychorismate lyase
VPIRTLQRGNNTTAWNYRVGSGIIWDSRPADEWEECLQKCSFLSAARPDFEIIESLLFTKNKKPLYAADHMKRMRASAAYFGYPFSSAEFSKTAAGIQRALSRRPGVFKVRMLLDKKGNLRWDSTMIDSTATDSTVLAVSNNPIDQTNKYLFHKTTHMPWYEEARKGIVQGKWYDVVFCNNKGEVTEGARSTIFIKKHDILFTPPVSSGLLPGVLRNRLIARNKCQEKILYFQDLLSADEIFCGNSVRGLKTVILEKK